MNNEYSLAAKYGNIPCLDGLRAVSILMVLCSHLIAPHLFPGGLGVLVFFVISGYLITRLLFAEYKNGGVNIKFFYVRRFLRLYPVIFIYTIVIVSYYFYSGYKINWIEPLSSFAYFANYLYSYYTVVDSSLASMPFQIFWSLSVEEHFYIAFPLLFIAFASKPRVFLQLLVFIALAVLVSRLAIAYAYPELLNSYTFYYQTQFRADSLVFGVIVAVLCEMEWGRNLCLRIANSDSIFASAIFLLLFSLLYREVFFRETIRYSLQSLAVSVILCGLVMTDKRKFFRAILNSELLVWIGKLSYSLYVWHLLVPRMMRYYDFSMPKWSSVSIEFVLVFLISAFSYYVIEKPVMGMRKQFGSHAR